MKRRSNYALNLVQPSIRTVFAKITTVCRTFFWVFLLALPLSKSSIWIAFITNRHGKNSESPPNSGKHSISHMSGILDCLLSSIKITNQMSDETGIAWYFRVGSHFSGQDTFDMLSIPVKCWLVILSNPNQFSIIDLIKNLQLPST